MRHTTHMDVGSADFAWSKNQPFILNITAHGHLGNCILHYPNTSHPCD